MAYYAFLNENNIVTEVISGKDEDDLSNLPNEFNSWEEYYENFRGQTCKRTSYNTIGNEHREGGVAFRGNYAAIGFIYDETNDVFYADQPYNSWTLNTSSWLWEPPVDMPNDPNNEYSWNENTQTWDIQQNINPE